MRVFQNIIYYRLIATLMLFLFSICFVISQDVTSEITNESTLNASDGTITLTVNNIGIYNPPPFYFEWSDAAGSILLEESDFDGLSTLINLSGGTYSVVITNANGCEASGDFEICSAMIENVIIVDIPPQGPPTAWGKIVIEVIGNLSDYQFLWIDVPNGVPPGGSSNVQFAPVPGEYTVKMVNSAGCIITETFFVHQCPGKFNTITVAVTEFENSSNACTFDGWIDITGIRWISTFRILMGNTTRLSTF